MNGKRKSVPVAGPTVIVSTVFLVLLCDGQWSRRASIIDVDLVFMARKRSAVVNRKNIQFVTIGRKSTMSIVFVSAFYGWIGHSQPATANIHGGFFLVCPFVWSFYYRGLFQSITPPAVIDLLRFCFTNSHCVSYRKKKNWF